MGEKYSPAMSITDEAEAALYFERLVDHCMRSCGESREEAERIERSNLGYFAGYYDSATRERVERLFSCEHPIFGKIAERGPPTLLEAFTAGVMMGAEARIKGNE
jgi:hypothetical protein